MQYQLLEELNNLLQSLEGNNKLTIAAPFSCPPTLP